MHCLSSPLPLISLYYLKFGVVGHRRTLYDVVLLLLLLLHLYDVTDAYNFQTEKILIFDITFVSFFCFKNILNVPIPPK